MEERMEASASQLSAMFDGELSAAECELLSRRLARDEVLRSRWARYALVGAAMRAEPIATVSGGFARRVGAALDQSVAVPAPRGFRRLRTVALGGSLAAGVAAVAVFLLRNEIQAHDEALTAYTPSVQRIAAPMTSAPATFGVRVPSLSIMGSGEPASYVVPPGSASSLRPVSASLANYVVAHSEYSSPLARRGLLSALVASDTGQIVDTPPAAISLTVVDEGAAALH
jgi:hypothetical protein